jgi:hypothetical protein
MEHEESTSLDEGAAAALAAVKKIMQDLGLVREPRLAVWLGTRSRKLQVRDIRLKLEEAARLKRLDVFVGHVYQERRRVQVSIPRKREALEALLQVVGRMVWAEWDERTLPLWYVDVEGFPLSTKDCDAKQVAQALGASSAVYRGRVLERDCKVYALVSEKALPCLYSFPKGEWGPIFDVGVEFQVNLPPVGCHKCGLRGHRTLCCCFEGGCSQAMKEKYKWEDRRKGETKPVGKVWSVEASGKGEAKAITQKVANDEGEAKSAAQPKEAASVEGESGARDAAVELASVENVVEAEVVSSEEEAGSSSEEECDNCGDDVETNSHSGGEEPDKAKKRRWGKRQVKAGSTAILTESSTASEPKEQWVDVARNGGSKSRGAKDKGKGKMGSEGKGAKGAKKAASKSGGQGGGKGR